MLLNEVYKLYLTETRSSTEVTQRDAKTQVHTEDMLTCQIQQISH